MAKNSVARSVASPAPASADYEADKRPAAVRLAGAGHAPQGPGGARELQLQIAERILAHQGADAGQWSPRRSLALAVGGSAALWAVIVAGVMMVRP